MIASQQTNLILDSIESRFNEVVSEFVNLPDADEVSSRAKYFLAESMLYSLNAGGKRIRPMLVLEMAASFGHSSDVAIDYAVAIEMIHTYSLIHDDLPCMDDDDLRRGKPTNHVVFGVDIATLAGDSLLNLAAEVMTKAVILNDGALNHLFAMREILNASGANGMILGQVADIKYHDEVMTVDTLDFINFNKTGRLLTAAIVSGAYIGGANEKEIALLREVGREIGLLFQIVDDILDVIGDAEKLGKRTQIDSKNNKTTYPSLLGLDGTYAVIQNLRDSLNIKLDQLTIDTTFLKRLIEFLVNREY